MQRLSKLFENGRQYLSDAWRSWSQTMHSLNNQDSIALNAQYILLAIVLIIVAGIRVWTIGIPALDRTQWKEIDYIEISRNFNEHGFNFLEPEISWPAIGSRIQPGELPIVPYLTALFIELGGFQALTIRLVPLLSYLILAVYIFRLANREFGPMIGLLSGICTAFMPLYHPFGRFLISEPTIMVASVVLLYHFAEWMEYSKLKDCIIAAAAFSIALALKPTELFMAIPVAWLVFRRYRFNYKRYLEILAWFALVLILPVAWYIYAYRLQASGVPQFLIFGGHDKYQTASMLLSIDWYRTMYYRIGSDVLGGKVGIFLAISGVIAAAALRRGGLFFAYLAGLALFMGFLAEGQIDAAYRQLEAIPVLAVFIALGALALSNAVIALIRQFKALSKYERMLPNLLLSGAILIILVIPVRRRHQILGLQGYDASVPAHPDRWRTAQLVREYSNQQDLLVVMGEYSIHVGGNDLSPVLYYYTGLKGWSLEQQDWTLEHIEVLISEGATRFVALPTFSSPTSPASWEGKEAQSLIEALKLRFHVLHEDDLQIIIDLTT